MLALRLNGKYLTLAPNASANVNLINPLFDRDGAERLYTFPFKLANSPENLVALQQANRIDRRGGRTTFTEAKMILQHQEFETAGVLELDGQAYTAKEISVVFKNEVPLLMEQLEKVQVNQILETVAVAASVPEAVFVWQQDVAAPALFQVGIGGNQYSYDAPGATLPSAIAQNLSDQINADFPGVAVWTPGQETIRIASEDIDGLGFDPAQFTNVSLLEFLTLGQQAQLRMQEFVDAISFVPDNRLTFPYLYWENFYSGGVVNYFKRMNTWVDGEYVHNEESSLTNEWKTSFVPLVRVPYVLSKVAEQVPGYLTGFLGFLETEDAQALVFLWNRALDQIYQNRYADGELYYLNGFQQNIDLNQHVPGLSASDLIQSLARFFACWMKLVGTKLYFIKKQAQLQHPPKDWTHLAEPAYAAQRKWQRGFSLEYPDLREEDAVFYGADGQLAPKASGEGFHEMPLPAGSAKVATPAVLPGTGTLLCPWLHQPGSSEGAGTGKNDCSFRLLFDRGLQPTTSFDNYVMATHGNTDVNGGTDGSLSLDLAAEDGLYERHHKGVAQLLADGEEVTVAVRLGIGELLEIRKWENSRRLVRFPEGQLVGVIKSVQFKASQRGLSIAKVVLVKEP